MLEKRELMICILQGENVFLNLYNTKLTLQQTVKLR